MGFLDLFIVSVIPTLKVLLVTAVGAFLAIDRVNLLGEDARKQFNHIVFYVFNPSLIATNLAKTITLDSMIKLWFMPLNILITFIVGSAFGWIVIQITRAPSHLRGLVLGCCAAGNLGNMLLIIIPAVCKEKDSPFGDPDTCYTFGMGYASLSMAIGAIYLWSYVYNIVRIYSSKTIEEAQVKISIDGSGESKTIKQVEVNVSVDSSGESSEEFMDSCKEALLPIKDYTPTMDYTTVDKNSKVPLFVKFGQQLKMFAVKMNLKRLFAPSTIGAIVGFGIGITPQIRNLLIGERAPLRVIQDSGALIAEGAIPVLTLIMGGNLTKGLKGSGVPPKIVIGIIVARYVLLPLSGIIIIRGAVFFGLVHSDPLYQFVLMLQFALPPAMNMGTITQLFGVGESECSVIMLWSYALASVALTLWCTIFMWLVS